jgi:hypothetical protein
MKLVIIGVVLLALVAGGLFGVAKFAPTMLPDTVLRMLGQPIPDRTVVKEERPKQTVLIDLEPITVPLFKDGDIDRFLVMHILVEVRPGPDQAKVNENLVRLVDVFITYTHALAALDIKPGISDRAFLKQRLKVKAEEILGQGVIVDLLFQNIFETPLHG